MRKLNSIFVVLALASIELTAQVLELRQRREQDKTVITQDSIDKEFNIACGDEPDDSISYCDEFKAVIELDDKDLGKVLYYTGKGFTDNIYKALVFNSKEQSYSYIDIAMELYPNKGDVEVIISREGRE